MTAVRSIRDATADLAVAQRVLRLEAEGLNALAASLDSRLGRSLDLLGAVKGRVVVTGMGKSGHIARKIAATLASTGTPALFVHPAVTRLGGMDEKRGRAGGWIDRPFQFGQHGGARPCGGLRQTPAHSPGRHHQRRR